jgi:hypothetical protein
MKLIQAVNLLIFTQGYAIRISAWKPTNLTEVAPCLVSDFEEVLGLNVKLETAAVSFIPPNSL